MVRVRVHDTVTDDDAGEALRPVRLAARDGVGVCDLVDIGRGEGRRPVRRVIRHNDRRRSDTLRVEDCRDFIISIGVFIVLNYDHLF